MRALRVVGVAMASLVGLMVTGGVAQAGGDAAKGKAAFQQYCGGCHGPTGKGDGPMGAAMNPKLKDLSDKGFTGSLKDDYLTKLIKEGGQALGKSPMMPKMGGALKDNEVEDVIAFMRSLAK